ncbi:MAG: LacI family DNA-binding transcriptional regulator [Rubrivivax sp.]|nr:LacI family DNA-binding transcriptional regulator [Rubrivivax sp.]
MPRRSTLPPATAAVTIRDVARAAGVHVSTVSRALAPAGPAGVSAEVAAAIKSAALRLGYRPNRAASALRTGRTHTIGVLLPDIANPLFPPILQGIEAHAAARGSFVLVANAAGAVAVKATLQRMLAQQVDGVILATAVRRDPMVDFIVESGLNAVLVNRADDSGRLASVVSDDRLAMRLVVEHLVARGCERLAHLAGPQDLPTGHGRRLAFEQALRDLGRRPGGIAHCKAYSREAGRDTTQRLLAARAPRPDALVCCNDLVALGAYDALAAAGLRVPADISVSGHNDMQLADLVHPALTTVRPPLREMGWRAAQLLFERLDGLPLSPAALVLPPELVVRGSTR